MTNKEIAKQFSLLAKIMELHGENPFKIRSYSNAYLTIRKLDRDLASMDMESLSQINGIGKAISSKIIELLETGEMKTLNKYKAITPPGIQEMLSIKGFGPKKIMTVWKDLGIESAGELLYACKENRLVELKGFGEKTQNQLIKQLEYFLDSSGKFLYANVIDEAEELKDILRSLLLDSQIEITGDIARKLPVIDRIEILTDFRGKVQQVLRDHKELELRNGAYFFKNIHFIIHQCTTEDFGNEFVRLSSHDEFWQRLIEQYPAVNASSEQEFFELRQMDFIPSEIREDPSIIDLAAKQDLPEIIQDSDIKGVIHNHSTYSDGMQSLEEMAKECKALGFEYFVISDHSKSAFYANGLSEDRLYHQWEEIDRLNQIMGPDFKIFKSIESDILSDGSLDYKDEILAQFDLVIASIHSNLRMDKTKATSRLVKAIENPHTRILGHPTGRLLLARPGYPIDHKVVIDACAENQVEIELNANPYRLDLDWSWIPYAVEKEVLISINPDAHSKSGIRDIHFGVCVARKACLNPVHCLNTKNRKEFEQWIRSKY